MFKGTMTKWPVQNPTHRMTQKHVHVEHHDATDIKKQTKLMKGKAPKKHSLHEKTAASVLLKLFISSNE